MSSEFALQIKNLSKCYSVYSKPTDRLKQFLVPKVRDAIGLSKRNYFDEFWALKNFSFSVQKGETIGILGRNGSGKSTLLQLICGTLSATNGSIQTSGKIAALLELGAGFNPEFTGRENVFLNASVLGLCRQEIEDRFDEFEKFADIGSFIDKPVKTYSTGMMMRLAFAVAINVEPDILVIDEALSVGDELFQRKCFSRIEEIKAKGATIIFVSHSGATIVELCDRAVLLHNGEKLASGEPKQILSVYQKLLYAPIDEQQEICQEIRGSKNIEGKPAKDIQRENKHQSDGLTEYFDENLKPQSEVSYISLGANISCPRVETESCLRVNNLIKGRKYNYIFDVSFEKVFTNVRFGMVIKTTTGVEIGGYTTESNSENAISYVSQQSKLKICFKLNCYLNPGIYYLNAGVLADTEDGTQYIDRKIDGCVFRVLPIKNNPSSAIVDFSITPKIIELET